MEDKDWLKRELARRDTTGSIKAIFNACLALLESREACLKREKASGANIMILARDDIKRWQNQLKITDEEEV